jgi:SHC-transforming protein 1
LRLFRECINRVCEAGGVKSVDKKRRVDRKVASMLGERPRMEKAGANVQLTITSLYLRLSDLDTGQVSFIHSLSGVYGTCVGFLSRDFLFPEKLKTFVL